MKLTDYRQICVLVVTRCNVVGIYIHAEERTPAYSSSETSVYYSSLIRRHVPEGHSLLRHPCVHLKSHQQHCKLVQDIHFRALNCNLPYSNQQSPKYRNIYNVTIKTLNLQHVSTLE